MNHRLGPGESGIAMPIAVMMVALLGVLGAGLLVFATTDLSFATEENQSQRAFEMADAGVKAAKRQLDQNATVTAYDGGGSDDVQWSSSKPNADTNCSGLGTSGVCLRNLDENTATDDAVSVAITSQAGGGFKVVATGKYGPARRKIDTVFKQGGGVGIPPTYFSRSSISLGGNTNLADISLFSFGNVTKSGGGSGSFTGNDEYFKKWAATGDSFTYPNPFNMTARSSNRRAVGALGTVDSWYSTSPQNAQVFTGTTSGTTANPRMVETPSSPQSSSQITFPFDTRMTTLDADIASLRQRAQELEAATGYDYYRPLPSPSTSATSAYRDISSWPSGANYETVVFYEFDSYSSTNVVKYTNSGGGCPTPSARGVIVVVNGNFEMAGSTGFNGGVITYTNPTGADRGTFSSSGGSCLVGYANATGNMSIQGTPGAGSVPALNTLSSFDGALSVANWRECYNATCTAP
ncbi:hypothetical protein [Rubrobacter indicoceani]|uniref:hypothetical protein n=1 Tax=Rubrobacter indicoceani TaxID=2051957 RepID=UPI000E5B010C|nr:hypothetical protein [Rubrobacter indicoceani]